LEKTANDFKDKLKQQELNNKKEMSKYEEKIKKTKM